MLSRDLIATVVRTFFEELGDMRDGGSKAETEKKYAGFYMTYFKQERLFFVQKSMQEVTTFFAGDPIQRIEMLAELMYRDAAFQAEQTMQVLMYKRIIELYDYIDMRTMEFSVERMNRVEELKNNMEI